MTKPEDVVFYLHASHDYYLDSALKVLEPRLEELLKACPEKQAAAAAGSLYPGSAVRLILSDRGERRLSLGWAVTLEGRLLWTQED